MLYIKNKLTLFLIILLSSLAGPLALAEATDTYYFVTAGGDTAEVYEISSFSQTNNYIGLHFEKENREALKENSHCLLIDKIYIKDFSFNNSFIKPTVIFPLQNQSEDVAEDPDPPITPIPLPVPLPTAILYASTYYESNDKGDTDKLITEYFISDRRQYTNRYRRYTSDRRTEGSVIFDHWSDNISSAIQEDPEIKALFSHFNSCENHLQENWPQ